MNAAVVVVASLADAWIETMTCKYCSKSHHVASLADAWIETGDYGDQIVAIVSRPSRTRGLKLKDTAGLKLKVGRVPRGRVD